MMGHNTTTATRQFAARAEYSNASVDPGLAVGCEKAQAMSTRNVDVDIVDGADAVTKCAADWQSIEAAGSPSTPFQSLSVAEAVAAAHIRRGEHPRLVVVRQFGRPVLIFPTVIASWLGLPVIRFLGDPLIQYGDMVATSDARHEHYAAAWDAAMDPKLASVALFRKVRADAKAAPFLAKVANVTKIQEAPFIDLYRPSALNARDKRELMRLRRRLSDRGDVQFELASGPIARDLLQGTLEIKRAWLREHTMLSAVIGDPDWERTLFELCDRDCGGAKLMIARLTVGGSMAATEVGFMDDRCWFAFLGAYSPEFSRAGPGQVLTADIVAHCRKERLSTYDLMPPSESYKRALANRFIPVTDYALALTSVGRLATIAARLVPEAKMLFESMPAGLRRVVLLLCRS